MPFFRSHYCCGVLLLATLSGFGATPSIAQTWPSKPIEMIVPFPPGAVENRVRLITERVAKSLGRPIVILNRPGGGWRVGADQLIRSAPDGHTLGVVGPPNLVMLPALEPKAGYDSRKDLTLLSLTYETPMVLVVNPSLGVKSVAEFVNLAKANPGKLNYGAPAGSSVYHMWFEVFKNTAKFDMVHIPYKGVAPALMDLAGGRTQASFGDSGVKAFIDQGKMLALATTGSQRSPLFPALPTIQESGVPFTATSWLGFGAPANLPRDITQRLVTTFAETLRAPDIRASLVASGAEFVLGQGPAELQARVDDEFRKFKIIGEELGIKFE